jgi:hypothetical protein
MYGGSEPAIILNPAATLADVLGWCALEAFEVYQLAELLCCANSDAELSPSMIAARFEHRLAPLAHMIERAASMAAIQEIRGTTGADAATVSDAKGQVHG